MTKHNEGLGVVGRGGGRDVRLGLGVDSGALVGHVSDVAVIAVGGVLHVLDTAVGEGNGVGAGNVGGTVGLLLGVEGGLGVVVSDGVGEGVGGDLVGVLLGVVGGGGGVVGGGGVHGVGNHGGGMDSVSNYGGSMDSVVDGGVHGVGNGVSDNS